MTLVEELHHAAAHSAAPHAATVSVTLLMHAAARIAELEQQAAGDARWKALLCGIVDHWNEFGAEHGLDEVIDRADRALMIEAGAMKDATAKDQPDAGGEQP